jgi:hypothetical protein
MVVQTATAARARAATTVVQTATTAGEVATTTVVQTATTARAPEPWHGRHPVRGAYERGFVQGFEAGVEIRTAPLRVVIPPPPVVQHVVVYGLQSPPPRVVALMLGHASWLFGQTAPRSEDHETACMVRAWLLSVM